MKPHEVARLSPYFANEVGIAEREPFSRLNAATTRFNNAVAQFGQVMDTEESDLFTYLAESLTLDPEGEAFFNTYLMPVHEQSSDGGRTTFSRFLVVDSRNPYSEPQGDENPGMRMRSYFLLLNGEQELGGGAEEFIFPYFVVSEQELVGINTAQPRLDHENSQVFHAWQYANMPLETGVQPQRVYDETFYTAMAAELERASAFFAQ